MPFYAPRVSRLRRTWVAIRWWLALIAWITLIFLLVFVPGTGEGFRGVILGAIIAGAVSIGGEWQRSEREARLDSTKRTDDRRIESNRIQRSVLLRLQVDLDEWTNHGPEEDEAFRRAIYRAERVVDDELRERLRSFLHGHDDDPAHGIADEYLDIRDLLGSVLRRYLEPPKE